MRHQILRHHMRAALCILGGAWLMAVACSPVITPPPPPIPQATPAGLPWGSPKSLGSAEMLSAPSVAFSGSLLTPSDGTTMFAWAGADQQESRLYAQSSDMTAPTILALKVTSPLDVTIAPSETGYFHLLWRDDVDGRPHLFYSLFNKEAVAVLDAYDLSEQPVYNFAVLPRDDGSVRVVYSAGWVAEPRLFIHDIDAKGRSQFPVALDQAGDFPMMPQSRSGSNFNGLFWQSEDGSIWQGQITGPTSTILVDPKPVITAPTLDPGDTIMHLNIVEDSRYFYIVWQLVRADGTPEAWYSVGETSDKQRWSPAMRLTIPTLGDTLTSGVSGNAIAVDRGAEPVSWVAVMPSQRSSSNLLIAVQTGDALGLASLDRGNFVTYQRITSVGQMISPPVLLMRNDASLVLAWAEVGTEAAQLYWLGSTP